MNLEIKETKKKVTYDDILNSIQYIVSSTPEKPQINQPIQQKPKELTKKEILSRILERKRQAQLQQERIKVMKPRNMNFT